MLVEHFPAEQIFKDVDNIEPGVDFAQRIPAAVESCDVLLALIGPDWLTMTDASGQRRLDNPEDFVRLEIETALERKIRVIPILVDNARMPRADELPPSLAPLVRQQAIEINTLTFDTERLISTVDKALADRLFDQAMAAFVAEEWDTAADLLGQVLRYQPDYAHAARILELASAELVDEPDRGRTPAAVVDENVQFTVYRPTAVQPKVWYPLLAFAHLAERRPDAPPGQPDPLEHVQELAEQALGEEAAYSTRVDAGAGVPREGQLTFAPFVEGVDFNPRSQTFEWQEDVHQQNFRLKARPDTAGRVLRGQLTVYLGAFILADIDLTFRVDLAAPPPPTPTVRGPVLNTSPASQTSPQPELTPATAVPYQRVFPSYSHKDLAIVRQAEVYGRALGHVYLRDRLALRSGEEWEVRLLELIDQADIFQLFWSSNSMNSEYVRLEWEHAQALGRRGFIRPTYWEVPMPKSTNPQLPPDELAKLHFHGFYEESPREDYEEPPRAYYGEPRSEDYREPPPAHYEGPPPAYYEEPPHASYYAEAPDAYYEEPATAPRRARKVRLIVAILAVLVAVVVVVFLLRGCAS